LAAAFGVIQHLHLKGAKRPLNKLTSELATTYGTIVIEDLNVAGMIRNRRLARSVADAGFGALRRRLAYKATWYGSQLVVADRWYPSSKTCSVCGTVKAKLSLSVRVFCCENCGISIDRDLNAARNLAAQVHEMVAGSGPETETPVEGTEDPVLAGQASAKRETSTAAARPGETGTVEPYGSTACR
jgi:putative transposase